MLRSVAGFSPPKEIHLPSYSKLCLVGNDWKIYDVVVEKISVVNNYSFQFSLIITDSSYEERVSRLKQNLAKGANLIPNS